MNPTMTSVKKAAAGVGLAAALGLGGIALGSGVSQAKPGNPGPPAPPVPGPAVPGITWTPGMPPGQNPFGPPGQVMKMPSIGVPGVGVIANPFYGVPPGHWGDRNYVNPRGITWLPPGFPDLTTPLNLVWNAAANAWGVFVNDVFVAYPIALPAPPPGT